MKRLLAFAITPGFHLCKLAIYVLLVPLSFAFGWMESVAYVSLLSIWALVETGVTAYLSALTAKPKEADDGN